MIKPYRKALVLLFFLVSGTTIISGQKAEVMIVRHITEHEVNFVVMDEFSRVLYDNIIIPGSDTVFLELEYDKQYKLQVENLDSSVDVFPLLSIILNNTPIIIVNSDIQPGDHSYSFFTGEGKPVLRIVGGTTASVQNYPWQVFVRAGNFLCGGTIIADKWVLTAAHCLFDNQDKRIPEEQISFIVGEERPFSEVPEESVYQVRHSVVHENYNDRSFENDIALLRTDEIILAENAGPLNLITASDVNAGFTDPGVSATVTGWGLISVDPIDFPSSLQKIEIPIVSKSIAELIWGPLPDNMLMAGFVNDKGDACRGDSGGPLIVDVNGEPKLAGIVSWGSSGCNSVGGYTRVSSFIDWLERNTGVGQNEFTTVRAWGSKFRCQNNIISGEIYESDTLSDALDYEWKIEPGISGSLLADGSSASVSWNSSFTGEAYVSVRALTSEGYTNWAGQRTETGKATGLLSALRDTSLCQFLPYRLSIIAEGSDLSYDWFRNGNLIKSGPEASYFFLELTVNSSGFYNVEVTGRCGTVVSQPAELSVVPRTEILLGPDDKTIAAGSDLRIQPSVVGDNLIFTWKRDDIVIEGTTGEELLVEDVNATNTGIYSFTVEGTCGVESSIPVYIYVDPGIADFPDGINIWPTLTRDRINVALESDRLFDIYIYDINGNYMGMKERNRYQASVELTGFSAGVYILKIQQDGSDKIYRFVKVNE